MLFVQPTKCPHDDEIMFLGTEYVRNNIVHVFYLDSMDFLRPVSQGVSGFWG